MGPTSRRQRLRTVSPERIAKVMEALKAKMGVGGVELRPDGSVVILTSAGPMPLSENQGKGGNEWDEVLTAVA